jgi:hypothetical protein
MMQAWRVSGRFEKKYFTSLSLPAIIKTMLFAIFAMYVIIYHFIEFGEQWELLLCGQQ